MEVGSYGYNRNLYNTLIRYDYSLTPQPELAEKWDLSSDGKALTLRLRQGVKYHSGHEFTSADVKATWEFAVGDPKTVLRTLFQTIKQVDTPDKYTAVLGLDTVNPSIFDALDVLYIVDKRAMEDAAKSADGTGPFKLDKYIPNDRAEFVPFQDYWDKGKPYVDRYVLRQIPDVSSMVVNLESGAVDCIWQPNHTDLARLKDSRGKFLVHPGAPGAFIYDLAVNVRAEPFTDKRVRQAMAWAIDRSRFCRSILQGLVEPTCLMWPAHSWAYFKDMEGKISFDLDKAAALLKEAGVGRGFETEIMTSSKRGFGYGELAQIIQADLTKIGVNAKIVDLEPAQYTAQFLNKGDHKIAVHTYGRSNRDPGTMVTAAKAFYTEKEGGWCHFESAEYDQLRADLQSTLDQEKRKTICRKIQEMILDESFTISVAPQQRAWAYGSHVKGFDLDLDDSPFVGNMWIER